MWIPRNAHMKAAGIQDSREDALAYIRHLAAGQPYDEDLDAYRWLVEEYRVSLFAQRLKTAVKVSEKRLADAWRTATS